MIREDYVSLETAMLLKEKGFDWEVHRSYIVNHNVFIPGYMDDIPLVKGAIRIPTLQMAMKWLREVHKIGVFPSIYAIIRGDDTAHVYDSAIISCGDTHKLMTNEYFERDSYEESAEAAIRYCLENLI